MRLNPYCNGRYSLSKANRRLRRMTNRLNPYCNGRYSLRRSSFGWDKSSHRVLILIVMEDTHWGLFFIETNFYFIRVLILIVMEDTHWGHPQGWEGAEELVGLNPYCNGRYSLRYYYYIYWSFSWCLNPYCNGRYSLSRQP